MQSDLRRFVRRMLRAARLGLTGTAMTLADAGADTEAKDAEHKTALAVAASLHHHGAARARWPRR